MDFETLKAECLACRRCSLCETRKNVVFGQGVPNAEVMFVGEGPGANEDEQGLPFVGRSGKLLDSYLEAIDLDRNRNIFIATWTAKKMCSSQISSSAARRKTAILCRRNPRPACPGYASSSSCCARKSWFVWAVWLPSR